MNPTLTQNNGLRLRYASLELERLVRKMFLRLFTALLPVTLFPALHMAGRDGGRNIGRWIWSDSDRFGWILSDIFLGEAWNAIIRSNEEMM